MNVLESPKGFFLPKILVIKEEGDTSNVNQACDQQVVKDDKTTMHAAVDALAPTLGIKMN